MNQFYTADTREFLLKSFAAGLKRLHSIPFSLLVFVHHDAVEEHVIRISFYEIVEDKADRDVAVVDSFGDEFFVEITFRNGKQVILNETLLVILHFKIRYFNQILFGYRF